MLPDRVLNPGPLTYESGALPIALRGPAGCEDALKGKTLLSTDNKFFKNDFLWDGSNYHKSELSPWRSIHLKINRYSIRGSNYVFSVPYQ